MEYRSKTTEPQKDLELEAQATSKNSNADRLKMRMNEKPYKKQSGPWFPSHTVYTQAIISPHTSTSLGVYSSVKFKKKDSGLGNTRLS